MAKKPGKKAEAEARARRLNQMLMEVKPEGLSERQWVIDAGVSSSFFTNLRGGSEPTVGNLRMVVEAIGLTLPEFFAAEARGRLASVPSKRALAAALREALPGLPRSSDRRAEYLADTVARLLALPSHIRANVPTEDGKDEAAA